MTNVKNAKKYNARMHAIFEEAKTLEQRKDDRVKFMGRNIGEKDGLYSLTWSENDLSAHDKRVTRWYFNSYRLAHQKMRSLRDNGTYWFDAHFDPTI